MIFLYSFIRWKFNHADAMLNAFNLPSVHLQTSGVILRIFSNCTKFIRNIVELSFEKLEAQQLYVKWYKHANIFPNRPFLIFQTSHIYPQDFDPDVRHFSAFIGIGGWIQVSWNLDPIPSQLEGLGERCKLPQWGLGQSPSCQRF